MSQNAGEKFNSTEFDNETRQDVNVLINEIESNVHIGTIDKINNDIRKQMLKVHVQKLNEIIEADEREVTRLRTAQDTSRRELDNYLIDDQTSERMMQYNASIVNTMKQHYINLESEYRSVIFPLNSLRAEIEQNYKTRRLARNMLENGLLTIDKTINKMVKKASENENNFKHYIDNYRQENEQFPLKLKSLQDRLKVSENKIMTLDSQVSTRRRDEQLFAKEESERYLNTLVVGKVLEEKSVLEQYQLQAIAIVRRNISHTKAKFESLTLVNDERQREDEAEINLAIEYDTKRQEMSKKVDELEKENEELLERLDHARKNNDYNLEALTIQNKHSLSELMDIDNEMHQIMEECLQEDQQCEKLEDLLEIKRRQFNLEAQRNNLASEINEKNALLSETHTELEEKLNKLISLRDDTVRELDDLKSTHVETLKTLNVKINELRDENNNQQIRYEQMIYEMNKDIENVKKESKNVIYDSEKANESSIREFETKSIELRDNLNDMKNKDSHITKEYKRQLQIQDRLSNKRDDLSRDIENSLLKPPEIVMKSALQPPPGILKFTNRTPIRRVSFQRNLNWESSESSAENTVTASNNVLIKNKSSEELFEELTGNRKDSPPEEL